MVLLALLLSGYPVLSSGQGTGTGGAATVPAPDHGAPQPLAPVKPEAPARGRVTGSVICGDTRQPARGAAVLLMPLSKSQDDGKIPGREMSARVGVNGTYRFDDVRPGEYSVVAFLQGYLSVLDELPSSTFTDPDGAMNMNKLLTGRSRVTVREDSAATLDLVLERGGTVSGRVLYADGAPANQVTISVDPVDAAPVSGKGEPGFDPQSFLKSMFTHQSFVVDDTGRFRVSGLKPGKYRIAAAPPIDLSDSGHEFGLGTAFAGMTDGKAIRYYSGDTYHKKQAKVYEVRAGDEIGGIDIRLPIDGFHSVRGTLTAVDGRPVNNGQLTLTDSTDDTLVYYARPDREGGFHFRGVQPGSYTLLAKNAFIGVVPPGTAPEMADQAPMQPTNAFADATAPVIVKDGDLTGVALSLTEVPLPKTPAQAPSAADGP